MHLQGVPNGLGGNSGDAGGDGCGGVSMAVVVVVVVVVVIVSVAVVVAVFTSSFIQNIFNCMFFLLPRKPQTNQLHHSIRRAQSPPPPGEVFFLGRGPRGRCPKRCSWLPQSTWLRPASYQHLIQSEMKLEGGLL